MRKDIILWFPFILVAIIFASTMTASAQIHDDIYPQQEDVTKTNPELSHTKMSKYESYASKTGSITKYIDFNLPKLSLRWESLETSIRVLRGEENAYFYHLYKAKTTSSLSSTTLIEYNDLVEINNALVKLSSEVETDIKSNPDYLENKFITNDRFVVGYYINKNKAQWFMKFDGNSFYFKEKEHLIDAFKNAQKKIEELMSANERVVCVKSVKYVNLAGVTSNMPFDGVNIVVTTHSNGTMSASKMLI